MLRLTRAADSLKPVLVLVGRAVLGTLLAGVLAVLGIGIAWGLYVFSGAGSRVVLLSLFVIGAGTGAGMGSFLAWLRIDRVPQAPVLAATALVLILAGVGGAWTGFQFGANQEVECCVGPAINPIGYLTLGSTVAANTLGLAMGIIYEIKVRGGWARFRPGAAESAL